MTTKQMLIDEKIKKLEEEMKTADADRVLTLRFVLRDLYTQKTAVGLAAAGFTKESYFR